MQVSNVARRRSGCRQRRAARARKHLVAYGSDAQKEGGDVSYFAVTMRNVTVDGWVVIVILAVMFVIALLIMIARPVLRACRRRTRVPQGVRRLQGDPTALDKPRADDAPGDAALDESPFMPHLKDQDDKYPLSTLYRLYHHGVQEMTGRTADVRRARAR